jgi:hypothetical protein
MRRGSRSWPALPVEPSCPRPRPERSRYAQSLPRSALGWERSWELLRIVANIGTAIVLLPILKRQSESIALGYVMARVVESAFIAIGILSVLPVVILRQDLAGTGSYPATLTTVGRSLVAIKDWTFLLGPGFVVGIGNGLMLGYLMFRSGLVPRRMAMLGLVGGPLMCASGIAVLFGGIEQGSATQSVATIPEFL